MIYHISRGDAKYSSRIQLQQSYFENEDSVVIDNVPYVSFRLIRLLKKGDVFIFHQHAMILNLIACYIVAFFYCRNDIKFVFDIHDLNEVKYAKSLKGELYFFIISICERIVFKFNIKFITVSKGLSNILIEKYGVEVICVYNIPKPDLINSRKVISDKTINLIYFGQINQNRLPLNVIRKLLCIDGVNLDIYGNFSGCNDEYIYNFNELISTTALSYKGKYQPNKIQEIVMCYDFSLMLLYDKRLNIRYCMPNKLFQSLISGVPIVVSDNLIEIHETFSNTGMVSLFSDFMLSRSLCLNEELLNETLNSLYVESKINFLDVIS